MNALDCNRALSRCATASRAAAASANSMSTTGGLSSPSLVIHIALAFIVCGT